MKTVYAIGFAVVASLAGAYLLKMVAPNAHASIFRPDVKATAT